MKTFNSLGSNFSWGMSFSALFSGKSKTKEDQLRASLAETYGGRATLTYKGQQALQLALMTSGLEKGAHIGINGFTCYAVYKAVERAGFKPVFIDIAKNSLNFDAESLADRHYKQPFSGIIVQNTLGIPCDIIAIEAFARKNRLLIIEDLAHSIGGIYADGRAMGTVGDIVMLSFSQDKTVDVVSGGALVDRRHVPADINGKPYKGTLQILKVRAYPLLTRLIRSTYGIGLGRLLHKAFKAMRLLTRPMDDVADVPQEMVTSGLLGTRWRLREIEFAHRRAITDIYKNELPGNLQFQETGSPVYVRFPIRVADPAALLAVFKKHGFYLGDTWYDGVLSPVRFLAKSNYTTGQCPNGEDVAKRILNLPTHQEITEEKAKQLCEIITQWQ